MTSVERAESEGTTSSEDWFAFAIGDDVLVVPDAWVRTIVDVRDVMRIPDSPALVEGVAHAAGQPMPLLSLAPLCERGPSEAEAEAGRGGRALSMSVDGNAFLLRCDTVLGPRRLVGPSEAPFETVDSAIAPFVDATLEVDGQRAHRLSAERIRLAVQGAREESVRAPRRHAPLLGPNESLVVLARGGRWIAIPAERLLRVLRPDEADGPSVDLDAWLGRDDDDAAPGRLLDLGEGLLIRTRAVMSIVGPEVARAMDLPDLLSPWAARHGIAGWVVREDSVGFLVDPVAWARSEHRGGAGVAAVPAPRLDV